MPDILQRSIAEPIRAGLTQDQRWAGPDKGLIWCWERGRQKAVEEPDLAEQAKRGEFVPLAWKRGSATLPGTLQYLATWQGLRGEDLNIDRAGETILTCPKTQKPRKFKAGHHGDEEAESE